MSIVAGKLFVGGASSVGITTGLVLLVVPYLKPEEASANTSIVLASEEAEEIEMLKPEETKPEDEAEEEEQDDNSSDEDSEKEDSSSENLKSENNADEGDEGGNNGEDETNSKDEKTEESGDEKNSDSNTKIPVGGNSSGKRTKTVKLRLIQKTDTNKRFADLTKLLGRLLKGKGR